MRDVILIDGKNLAWRMHHTHRYLQSHGRSTSVLYGVLSGMLSIAKKAPKSPLVFVWDGGGKTWRHELLATRFKEKGVVVELPSKEVPKVKAPMGAELDKVLSAPVDQRREKKDGYKANRGDKPDHLLVNEQVLILRGFLSKLGFREFCVKNLEADDLIGILATHIIKKDLFDRVIIYSTDRDFFQLISDRVKVWRPTKESRGMTFIKDGAVMGEYGIYPKDWIKMRSLTGDKSDNIPQIQFRLGEKTASKMILAGLDPSFTEFENHPSNVKLEFKDFASKWKDVHQNYLLTKIIRKPNHSLLSEEQRNNLFSLLSDVDHRSKLYRNSRAATDDNFRFFLDFVASYEMNELLVRKREFWTLP